MPSQSVSGYSERLELEAWRQAAILVVALSAFVFLIQRFFGPIFEVTFEIFIFHVPAIAIAVLYLYFRKRLTVKN
jgi:4-hydroxybenzoate polyprenyltransferase